MFYLIIKFFYRNVYISGLLNGYIFYIYTLFRNMCIYVHLTLYTQQKLNVSVFFKEH